jgi:hypothetical protein
MGSSACQQVVDAQLYWPAYATYARLPSRQQGSMPREAPAARELYNSKHVCLVAPGRLQAEHLLTHHQFPA